jgi:hypothetical protein
MERNQRNFHGARGPSLPTVPAVSQPAPGVADGDEWIGHGNRRDRRQRAKGLRLREVGATQGVDTLPYGRVANPLGDRGPYGRCFLSGPSRTKLWSAMAGAFSWLTIYGITRSITWTYPSKSRARQETGGHDGDTPGPPRRRRAIPSARSSGRQSIVMKARRLLSKAQVRKLPDLPE